MINSLKCVKRLEECGVSREQAEAHVQIISEIIEMNLATKDDLKDLKQSMKDEFGVFKNLMKEDFTEYKQSMKAEYGEFKQLMKDDFSGYKQSMTDLFIEFKQAIGHEIAEARQSSKNDFIELRHEIVLLDQKIIQSEQRMTIKLGTIVSVAIGVAVALSRLLS